MVMSRPTVDARRPDAPLRSPRQKKSKLRAPMPTPLAAELGIRRMQLIYRNGGALGDTRYKSMTTLSGGDGAIFTWWRVECRTVAEPGQCRSPDGCGEQRLDGRSYCAAHRLLYYRPPPPPTRRLMLLIDRKRQHVVPKLNLTAR